MNSCDKWRREKNISAVEDFLREQECYSVTAVSHFLDDCKHVWTLKDEQKRITALIIYTKGYLLPLFNKNLDIPSPYFMNNFLRKIYLHTAQGLLREVEILENVLSSFGKYAVESADYDLMTLDKEPNPMCLSAGPRNLILRRPTMLDIDELFHLQAAYLKEEMLREGDIFNPAVCRLLLEKIMANELILVACLNGRILGKINTNAVGFSRYQVGGVYVLPEYRNLGIASRLTAAFVEDIIYGGKGVNLFVKKENRAARSMYMRVGFNVIADYRISYF